MTNLPQHILDLNPGIEKRRKRKKQTVEIKESELERSFSLRLLQVAPFLPKATRNYLFHPVRGWAIDYAYIPWMVSVEIDGGIYEERGGRHNTTEDRLKCNTATALGWAVLHFDTDAVNDDPIGCIDILIETLILRGWAYGGGYDDQWNDYLDRMKERST